MLLYLCINLFSSNVTVSFEIIETETEIIYTLGSNRTLIESEFIIVVNLSKVENSYDILHRKRNKY